MKRKLRASLESALDHLRTRGEIPHEATADYTIETPKQTAHGDFSTNVAMLLAKSCRRPPHEIATLIAAEMSALDLLEQVEVAGAGFINFVIRNRDVFGIIRRIYAEQESYGCCDLGAGRKVQLEFVSANPTGPLHIGHGRGAAFGSSLANLFETCGYEVHREYYVNDAGRQMDILALSVWLRYLESFGVGVEFPQLAYQGGYIGQIASALKARCGEAMLVEASALQNIDASGDPERALDDMIAKAKQALGPQRFDEIHRSAKGTILEEIKADLAEFGVRFDSWYSETSLDQRGLIDDAIDALDQCGQLFDESGARWFKSSAFGDEKDRVVVRENGAKTYFASDIAYHLDKFSRGFESVIDIWGADHHGYIPRVKAAMQALDLDPENLEILLVQFATLFRGGEKVAMSTRTGEFVTLKQLVEDVGVDAARFFYVMRRSDQHLEFDLDLAKAQSNDNPVYYVQYAHARICSVLRQMNERKLKVTGCTEALDEYLVEPAERAIAVLLAQYPDVVETACLGREPHQLSNYLRDLATEFHAYYNAHRMLVDDDAVRNARIALVSAVRQIIANGLAILGIQAPMEM
ncbi:MAG: arginine--tRNA ligase [Proteobacteria bacterium]|nr:arginine--tRNA ligase [Pseudomonadota bacterium]